MSVRVELVMVYSDGCGGGLYELRFVDDDDLSGAELRVYPDGTMEVVTDDVEGER